MFSDASTATETTQTTERQDGTGSVDSVVSVPVPFGENPAAPTEHDPARWTRFEALCIDRGVTADELAGHFFDEASREDIECSHDAALDTFAEHMAGVILAERRARAVRELLDAVEGADEAPLAPTLEDAAGGPVRSCDDCRHRRPSSVNPTGGLVGCAVRADAKPHMPGRRIACRAFEVAP